MAFSRSAAALLAALSLVAAERPASAQCESCREPRAGRDGVSLAANAVLGGATAAVRARLHRRPVLRALAGGAAGGALTYAGKRISVERAWGAGLAGREVAALGTSLSANAAEGRGALDRLVLPAGPVRLYLATRGGGPLLRARVDLAALAAAAYAAASPGSRFDAAESLSSGAMVFRVRGGLGELAYEARHAAGVVQVRDGEDPARVARASAHERVHVIQYDQTFLLWAAPAEAAVMERARWSRGLHRWADVGVNAPALAAVGAVLPYRAQPWESEAEYLSSAPLGRGDIR
ncbi:MAG: hypothetical protein ACJ8GN_30365 [Longimicrobiaceae bacterium]